MKKLILFTLVLFALRAHAAMVRVVAIEDGRTITVEDRGKRIRLRLSGIAVTDELRAAELLRWTLSNAWVMAEPAADGALVYRSPDALFINRELVLRGYARATEPGIEPDNRPAVTYLGEVNPQGPQERARKSEPEPRSGSDTIRPPRATPSRQPRSRPRAPSAARSGHPRPRRAP